jgi:hypothetical protein
MYWRDFVLLHSVWLSVLSFDIYHGDDSLFYFRPFFHLFSLSVLNNMQPVSILER